MPRKRSAADERLHDLLVAACSVPGASVADIAKKLGVEVKKARNWVSRASRSPADKAKVEPVQASAEGVSAIVAIVAGDETVAELDQRIALASRHALLEVLASPDSPSSTRLKAILEALTLTQQVDEPDKASDHVEPTRAEVLAAIASKVPPSELVRILHEQGHPYPEAQA